MSSITNFLELSKELTGVDDLDPALADDYYHKLREKFNIHFDELLGIYDQVKLANSIHDQVKLANSIHDQVKLANDPFDALIAAIAKDPEVFHVAKQIVRVWFVSQFKEFPDITNKPQVYAGHWEKGILWRLIKTQAPGFSKRKHAYWAKRPRP